MIQPIPDLTTLLKAFGDPTRLRILALVELEEVSVGELSRALAMSQSRVSNHLRVLRDADLLVERHVGSSNRLRSALVEGSDAREACYPLQVWQGLRAGLASLPEHQADRCRLSDLVALRRAESRDFFDRMAGEWDKLGPHFMNGQARQCAAAGLLPTGLAIADLGCGTGYFGRALCGIAARLVCVDRSPAMLDEARKRLSSAPTSTLVEYRLGELDQLPLESSELDGALAGMVLHHLEHMDAPLHEMRRVLRPGGTAVVIELAPHREEWMRAALGDRHLGLAPRDVVDSFLRAGFRDVSLEESEDRYQPRHPEGAEAPSLPLFTVRGHAPADSNH